MGRLNWLIIALAALLLATACGGATEPTPTPTQTLVVAGWRITLVSITDDSVYPPPAGKRVIQFDLVLERTGAFGLGCCNLQDSENFVYAPFTTTAEIDIGFLPVGGKTRMQMVFAIPENTRPAKLVIQPVKGAATYFDVSGY